MKSERNNAERRTGSVLFCKQTDSSNLNSKKNYIFNLWIKQKMCQKKCKPNNTEENRVTDNYYNNEGKWHGRIGQRVQKMIIKHNCRIPLGNVYSCMLILANIVLYFYIYILSRTVEAIINTNSCSSLTLWVCIVFSFTILFPLFE